MQDDLQESDPERFRKLLLNQTFIRSIPNWIGEIGMAPNQLSPGWTAWGCPSDPP